MDTQEARQTVIDAILDVAPDTDPNSISDDASFRETLGIDSMDFLDILEQVADETGVEVPEKDYPQVESISGFASYLSKTS